MAASTSSPEGILPMPDMNERAPDRPAAAPPVLSGPVGGEQNLDRGLHAAQARLTGGLSPAAIGIAWADWFMHLVDQPGRQASLMRQGAADATALLRQSSGLPVETLSPAPEDHRFTDPGWQRGYFALAQQKFLRAERFWQQATSNLPGLSKPHERIVNFLARQMLDVLAPANFPFLNPEVLAACQSTGFANLKAGSENFIDDLAAAGKGRRQKLPLA